MDEKTIESMVREKEQEANKENSNAAGKHNMDEDKTPSMGQKKNALKNVEGDIKNIETELKISTSSEVELGLVGQLKGLIEKIKSGQLDLTTAQNLLRNVNSLKGRVSTDLNKTNSLIKSTREMDNNIDKLYKLVQDKYDKELNDDKNKDKDNIEELENLLRELEEKKKNLKKFMGYLLIEQKALKSINKGINGIQTAIQRQSPSIKGPAGIGKFIVAITNGISALVKRSTKVNLPKDIEKRVSLNNENKDGIKNIENANEGILKILAQYGEVDKVKRILGADRLKQDITKPINMAREETRNSIERKTNKTQQLEIAEKHGVIKKDSLFMHGKNKLYAPTIAKSKSHTKNNTLARNIGSRDKK